MTNTTPMCECCLTEFMPEYRSNMSTITAVTKDNHFCFSLCEACYAKVSAKMSDTFLMIRKNRNTDLKYPHQFIRR